MEGLEKGDKGTGQAVENGRSQGLTEPYALATAFLSCPPTPIKKGPAFAGPKLRISGRNEMPRFRSSDRPPRRAK